MTNRNKNSIQYIMIIKNLLMRWPNTSIISARKKKNSPCSSHGIVLFLLCVCVSLSMMFSASEIIMSQPARHAHGTHINFMLWNSVLCVWNRAHSTANSDEVKRRSKRSKFAEYSRKNVSKREKKATETRKSPKRCRSASASGKKPVRKKKKIESESSMYQYTHMRKSDAKCGHECERERLKKKRKGSFGSSRKKSPTKMIYRVEEQRVCVTVWFSNDSWICGL